MTDSEGNRPPADDDIVQHLAAWANDILALSMAHARLREDQASRAAAHGNWKYDFPATGIIIAKHNNAKAQVDRAAWSLVTAYLQRGQLNAAVEVRALADNILRCFT